MWSKRSKGLANVRLLVLSSKQQFVFLLHLTTPQRRKDRDARVETVLKQMRMWSPFRDTRLDASLADSYVVAFEVDWKHIVGLDYVNQLCLDGRVVIEAHQVVKKVYATLEMATAAYMLRAPHSPAHLRASPRFLSQWRSPQLSHSRHSSPAFPSLVASPGTTPDLDLPKGLLTPVYDLQDVHGSAAQPGMGVRRTLDLSGAAGQAFGATQDQPIPAAAPLTESGADKQLHNGPVKAAAATAIGVCATAVAADAVSASAAVAAAEALAAQVPSPSNGMQISAFAAAASAPIPIGQLRPSLVVSGTPAGLQGGTPDAAGRYLRDAEDAAGAPLLGGLADALPTKEQQSPEGTLKGTPDTGYPPFSDFHASPSRLAVAEARQNSWPAQPATWTSISDTFDYRTIIFNFNNDAIPRILRPIIEGDERLLKLYESGLPTWAIYMPAWGCYYRPWMRWVTWLLFIAISFFSLACGFYDLYKNVPYLDQVMRRMLGSMRLPSFAIMRWLDEHVQIRLSILLGYLFGKSVFFMDLLRWAGSMGRYARTLLQPATDILGPPLQEVALLVQGYGSYLWGGVSGLGLLLGAAGQAVLAPLLTLLQSVLIPFVTVVRTLIVGPLAVLNAVLGYLVGSGVLLWSGLQAVWGGVAATAKAVQASMRLAPAAQQMGNQVSWWYVLDVPLDVLRNSAVKSARASQTVLKFLTQLCSDIARHRLTLSLRLSRQWQRVRARLEQQLQPPVVLLLTVLHWLWAQAKVCLDYLSSIRRPVATVPVAEDISATVPSVQSPVLGSALGLEKHPKQA